MLDDNNVAAKSCTQWPESADDEAWDVNDDDRRDQLDRQSTVTMKFNKVPFGLRESREYILSD